METCAKSSIDVTIDNIYHFFLQLNERAHKFVISEQSEKLNL